MYEKVGNYFMCGIVGIVGNEQAVDILVAGLEKLEYRGYDSAGIFVANRTQHFLVKSEGRIENLKEKMTPKIQGNIGIGHTRWATHGKPSESNAHPHVSRSGQFVLVHNGVLENFEEIKRDYIMTSETDTEVAVNLIDYFSKKTDSTEEAFKEALKIIRGSYAFGLIDTQETNKIYVAKNKSPLLIGLGDEFHVICSDAMAMLTYTNQFIEISDEEMVIVEAKTIKIEDKQGNLISRQPYEAQIDLSNIDKGTYPYYMLKEIDEQPSVMRKIIQAYTNESTQMKIDEEIIQTIHQSDRIYIIACGTSYNAGWVGKSLLESLMNIPVEVHLSSEFGYNIPLLSKKPFFIFLSQSGETADSRQVLVQINNLGFPSLTVTNVAGSTLSREASYTLLLHAGPEIAVASTKAYTAQIALLAVLAKAVGESKKIKKAQLFDVVHELSLVASNIEVMINEKSSIHQLVDEYLTNQRNTFYIGRGVDYCVSMEAALKLKEISYIQAEGFAAGELKHGTIALIEEGTPVVGIITDEKTAAHTRGNLKEVESRGAHTLVISLTSLSKETDEIILPEVHPLLAPLVSVIPTQLIAYYATLQRGYDVDKPRNLAKSVTVE